MFRKIKEFFAPLFSGPQDGEAIADFATDQLNESFEQHICLNFLSEADRKDTLEAVNKWAAPIVLRPDKFDSGLPNVAILDRKAYLDSLSKKGVELQLQAMQCRPSMYGAETIEAYKDKLIEIGKK